MGLDVADDIDALCVSDVGERGHLDVGDDEALFSLAPGSPTLIGMGRSPGDVFYTRFDGSFSIYALASDIGLMESDNLNALDISTHEQGQPTISPQIPTECPMLATECYAPATICNPQGYALTVCPFPGSETRCPTRSS